MKIIFAFLTFFAADAWACSPMGDLVFEDCSKRGVVKVHEPSATALEKHLIQMQAELDRIIALVKGDRNLIEGQSSCFNQQFFAMNFDDFRRTQKQNAGKVCTEHIERVTGSAQGMANEKSEELRFISKSSEYPKYLKQVAELKKKVAEFSKQHQTK